MLLFSGEESAGSWLDVQITSGNSESKFPKDYRGKTTGAFIVSHSPARNKRPI